MSFLGVVESISFSVIQTSIQLVGGLAFGSILDYLWQKYVYATYNVTPTSATQAIELLLAIAGQLILLCLGSAVALTVASAASMPDPAMGLAFLLSSEYASTTLQSALITLTTYIKSELLSGTAAMSNARTQKLEHGMEGVMDRRTIIDSHQRRALRDIQSVAVFD